MQLKITVAVVVLALLVIVPVMRADSIRAPTQRGFDRVGVMTSALANTGAANHALTFDPEGRDDDPPSLPEPASIIPALVLAAGFVILRKRLVTIH